MGTWGFAPWDNDAAADWYGELFDEIPLAAKVEETLNGDPEEYAAEIRAASALLILLGRTYIWPIDDINRHLKLAISQMERVHATYQDEPEVAAAVADEIALLKSRQANTQDASVLAQPTRWGNFWS